MYITIISQLNWTYGFSHDFPMMLVDHFRLAPLAPLGDPGVRGDPRLYTPMGCGTLLMRDPLDPSRVCKICALHHQYLGADIWHLVI